MAVRALRGATTLDVDETSHMSERVRALLAQMLERNGVAHDDLISVVFTATDDLHSGFPAVAAREMGLGDVPLLCARELDIEGGMPMCVRVLMHVESDRARGELRHVYLEQGSSQVNEASEDEEDRVEEAPGIKRTSRLSCQCELKDLGEGKRLPIVVRVPAWNRNAVKEIPH